jgi:hypothetical protein
LHHSQEFAKTQATGNIEEVLHPEWLANQVMVVKKDGKWRLCIDYISLNKTCSKDPCCLASIKSSTPPPIAGPYASSMHI